MSPLSETPTRFAIFAGRIHTVSNGTLEDAAILVENGKIAEYRATVQVTFVLEGT